MCVGPREAGISRGTENTPGKSRVLFYRSRIEKRESFPSIILLKDHQSFKFSLPVDDSRDLAEDLDEFFSSN